MDAERVWNVSKWILAVLAAGFIGQFGRSFALRLIDRRRHAAAPSATAPPDASGETAHPKASAKIAKKRAKAEAKKKKKSAERRSPD